MYPWFSWILFLCPISPHRSILHPFLPYSPQEADFHVFWLPVVNQSGALASYRTEWGQNISPAGSLPLELSQVGLSLRQDKALSPQHFYQPLVPLAVGMATALLLLAPGNCTISYDSLT